jgi:Gluconate 2-dehydrogenase subunit 3
MQRRDALKFLAAGLLAPAAAPEVFAFFQEAHPASGYALRTLNPHQNALVVLMSEIIIPETDTPGAKGARVNEFIDVILTEWATDEDRSHFLDGLAGVDKQSNELFGKDFAEASAAQQLTLMQAMDEAVAIAGSGPARHGNTVPERDTQLRGSFFRVFKSISLHGYYTSEIGFSRELGLVIIPGAQHGCVPVAVAAEKKA